MAPQGNTGSGAEAELPEYAGHYHLESCLGSGGMGVVHVARSTSGMKLAVKVVHAQYAKDPEFRGRFRQEVAAARRVSGAFTASVVDADPEAERPWMATLFIPGPTLSDHVKRNGPMAPDQLRRLMAGLAEALRDIHRVGVVHRDLKPSNVLLAEDGPKVIDFGISRPKDSELRTETGKLIGTPPFMAPEQFRRPREVGPAADIFALGSVMVHASTGRGPFDSDSPYVVAYQVVHDEPDLTGVPANLGPLILRCLAKEPEDRPTPDELMRELRSVSASYDTQAFIPAQRDGGDVPRPVPEAPEEPEAPKEPQDSAKKSEARPGRRGPNRRTLLAAGALVLAACGVLASVQMSGDDSAPGTGESSPTNSASGSGGWVSKPVSGKPGMPQCSYGSGKLLCAQSGVIFALDPVDGSLLWRHSVPASTRSGPPVLAGGLVQPMTDGSRRLEALDPATGKARWERDMPAYNGLRPAGGMLLLTGAGGKVVGVDGASGDTEWQGRIPGQSAPYFDSFSGDPLAYAWSNIGAGTSTRIAAVDPATGDVRWDTELKGTLQPAGVSDGSVYFLSVDHTTGATKAIVRYDPGSGAVRQVELPVLRYGARASVHGNVVYLLAAGGSLEAVDMDARRRLWNFETSVSRGSVPVSDGTHVYVSTADGRLLAVDARKGTFLGQTRPRLGENTDQVTASLPTPLLEDGNVYAAAPDGTVFTVTTRDPAAW